MTDERTAALAEALENHRPVGLSEVQIAHDRGRCGVECAAAILAELPPDWCGHALSSAFVAARAQTVGYEIGKAEGEAELARLRAIEEAARALVFDYERTGAEPPTDDEWDPLYLALRAALGEDR